MMKLQNLFLLLIGFLGLILCVGNSPVYAEDIYNNGKQHHGWLNLGIGPSGLSFFSVGGNFSYQIGRHLFSIRYIYTEEIDAFGYGGKMERGYDLGILYGGIAKRKYGFASLSVGFGIVDRVKEEEKFFSIGIPIEGQLFFTPLPFLGIGLSPFANPTLKGEFFGGLLLCIQIGKLR